jgi:hypothetical protein
MLLLGNILIRGRDRGDSETSRHKKRAIKLFIWYPRRGLFPLYIFS